MISQKQGSKAESKVNLKWAVTGLIFLLAFKINKTKFHSEKENKSGENKFTYRQKPSFYLTIGSCFIVHYRVMEHVGSLESTKEA